MHRTVKSHPHHLRDAARIIAVRLIDAVDTDLRFTISLKRSTQNLQLSTSWPADYPIFHQQRTCSCIGSHPSRADFVAKLPNYFAAIFSKETKLNHARRLIWYPGCWRSRL
jgi:hypothetical protein